LSATADAPPLMFSPPLSPAGAMPRHYAMLALMIGGYIRRDRRRCHAIDAHIDA